MSCSAPVLTIDGPSGSGKGTLSRLLAKKLGWHWLDSGAIYRLLALSALKQSIDLDDGEALATQAQQLDIAFIDDDEGNPDVLLDGESVRYELRTETCGAAASKVAAQPVVREALLKRQQDFCQTPGLVADGRDMGTVVFPDAELKVFLTASIEERAKRRHKQLKEQGLEISIDDLFQEISARDERDTNRSVSPLRPAEDAKVVDCSHLSIEEMLECALDLVDGKGWVVPS